MCPSLPCACAGTLPPCQSSSLPAKAATLPEAFTCMSNTAKTSPCNAYASCACSRAANALLSARKAKATSASDAGAPLRKAALQASERTSCKRHHGRSQSGSITGGDEVITFLLSRRATVSLSPRLSMALMRARIVALQKRHQLPGMAMLLPRT